MAQTLPAIRPLLSREAIESFDNDLRTAVVTALNKHSPQKARTGKHKEWWRPEILDPLRKEANRLRRALKRTKTEESRAAYRAARNAFNQAIDRAKESS